MTVRGGTKAKRALRRQHKEDKPLDISSNHAIRKIWKNRKLTAFQLAEEGDVSAVRHLLNEFIYRMAMHDETLDKCKTLTKNNERFECEQSAQRWLPRPELLTWLSNCFQKALKDKKTKTDRDRPNLTAAFYPKSSKGRRRLDSKEMEDRLDIAYFVAKKVNEGESIAAASRDAAKQYGCGWKKAEKAYTSLMQLKRRKNKPN